MIFSFLIGILVSALIVTQGHVVDAGILASRHLLNSTGLKYLSSWTSFMGSWNLLIFMFLICLGILIVLLTESGAASAYVRLVSRAVKTRKEAESASLLLSLFFFIDDYFSALTVGSVMRPLARLHNIHPVKLAFLTTAMATPLTIISPISSWVGEIILQLKQVGIGPEGAQTVIVTDPYTLFIHAIPYLLYPLLVILGTWYIVLRNISYGPMQKYDDIKSPNLSAIPSDKQHASFIDFVLPLLVLIGTVGVMMLVTGGYSLFGGMHDFVSALKHASVHVALFSGGMLSLVASIFYYGIKKTISPTMLGQCIIKGTLLMLPSILMLICAWSLGSILKNDLKTGSYIASIVASSINIEWFPVISYLCATLIALMIGSAWATIGLMFPILIDMLQKLLDLGFNTPLDAVPLIFPLVGATLSGAVLGVHLSLIADNPIMSAASTGANHLEHVKTMAWYTIPIGICAGIGFICIGLMAHPIGFGPSLILGGCGSAFLTCITLEICQYLFHAKS
jgi:Na+/H+ antiporter NhaC